MTDTRASRGAELLEAFDAMVARVASCYPNDPRTFAEQAAELRAEVTRLQEEKDGAVRALVDATSYDYHDALRLAHAYSGSTELKAKLEAAEGALREVKAEREAWRLKFIEKSDLFVAELGHRRAFEVSNRTLRAQLAALRGGDPRRQQDEQP